MRMIEMLNVEPKVGEIGIEVELEGEGLPKRHTASWRVEGDGSLRGESIEMVLKTPVKRISMQAKLREFEKAIKGARIEDSGRAGIHIHINIQELTSRELAQFMCLYLVFENTLVEWCGQGRVGNLFCLRCEDAPGLLDQLQLAFKSEDWQHLNTDELRYASMNAKAVCTYGSLEFRAMRSTRDIRLISQWAKMLLAIKDKAVKFNSPMEIVEGLSLRGVEAFYDDVVGGFPGLKFRNTDLMTGVRNAQQLAYARQDWGKLVVKTYDYDGLDVIQDEEAAAPKAFRQMDFGIPKMMKPEKRGPLRNHPIPPDLLDERDDEEPVQGDVLVDPDMAPAAVEMPMAGQAVRHQDRGEGLPAGDRGRDRGKQRVLRNGGMYYRIRTRGQYHWLTVMDIDHLARRMVLDTLSAAGIERLNSFFSNHWMDIILGKHTNARLPMALLQAVREIEIAEMDEQLDEDEEDME
jgi:hypothetical protein